MLPYYAMIATTLLLGAGVLLGLGMWAGLALARWVARGIQRRIRATQLDRREAAARTRRAAADRARALASAPTQQLPIYRPGYAGAFARGQTLVDGPVARPAVGPFTPWRPAVRPDHDAALRALIPAQRRYGRRP